MKRNRKKEESLAKHQEYFNQLKAENPNRTDNILWKAAGVKNKETLKRSHYEDVFRDELISMGIEFEYQKVFMNDRTFYCVDFYLTEEDVVVEIDGESHYERRSYDANRTRTLHEYNGVTNVVRFQNDDIEENPNWCVLIAMGRMRDVFKQRDIVGMNDIFSQRRPELYYPMTDEMFRENPQDTSGIIKRQAIRYMHNGLDSIYEQKPLFVSDNAIDIVFRITIDNINFIMRDFIADYANTDSVLYYDLVMREMELYKDVLKETNGAPYIKNPYKVKTHNKA